MLWRFTGFENILKIFKEFLPLLKNGLTVSHFAIGEIPYKAVYIIRPFNIDNP